MFYLEFFDEESNQWMSAIGEYGKHYRFGRCKEVIILLMECMDFNKSKGVEWRILEEDKTIVWNKKINLN